jgi:hypothetical protein
MANIRRSLWTIRSSYLYQAKHQNDIFLNTGYDYRGNMLRNGTSDELWANPLQIGMYAKLEGLITFCLEQAKMIKKTFSFAHDKNSLNVN